MSKLQKNSANYTSGFRSGHRRRFTDAVLSPAWGNPSDIGLFTPAQRKIPTNAVVVKYARASFVF